MRNLKKCGISEVVISTCYHPEYIEEYFGDGTKFDLKIKYIVEETPMGTGGAIKMAEEYFNEPFLVFNSDILSDIDISKMIEFHQSKKAVASIAVTEVQDPSMYGVIEYDKNGYAITFKEKPKAGESTSKSINAGIYIFEPSIFAEIASDRAVSIEREIFPKLLNNNQKISIYKSGSYWMDIGTIQKYRQAHWDIMSGKCKLVDCDFNSENVSIGENVTIHPSAIVVGPAYIGDNANIGAKVIINHSVIGNNVSIGAESSIIGSVLWNDIIISKKATLVDSVVTASSFEADEIVLLKTLTIIEPLSTKKLSDEAIEKSELTKIEFRKGDKI
ncbi:MAG: Mannose-phosphate guanylyltransferase [Herbinix sp.]|nr:Mannose-phosphate guanylyltransferase [Herbinix sp.]